MFLSLPIRLRISLLGSLRCSAQSLNSRTSIQSCITHGSLCFARMMHLGRACATWTNRNHVNPNTNWFFQVSRYRSFQGEFQWTYNLYRCASQTNFVSESDQFPWVVRLGRWWPFRRTSLEVKNFPQSTHQRLQFTGLRFAWSGQRSLGSDPRDLSAWKCTLPRRQTPPA